MKKDKISKASLVILLSLFLKLFIYIKITEVIAHRFLVLFISFSIVFLIYKLLEFIPLKYKKIFKGGLYLLISLLIIADTIHYSYFNSLTSIVLFKQMDQLGAISDSIFNLINFWTIVLIVDIPLVLYYLAREEGELELTYLNYAPPMVFLGLLLAYGFFYLTDSLPILYNQELFTYHLVDILDLEEDIVISQEDLKKINSISHDYYRSMEDKDRLKFFGLAKDRDVFVIQIEALQNFVIGLNYNGQEVTPNINRLINEGSSLYFDNYFQLTGRGNTSDAEFVSNNSLHPSMEEYTYLQYEDRDYYGLPWILREAGYNAWVYHGYDKEFWNRERAYDYQGFQRFISEEDYSLDELIGFGLSDRLFFKESLDYIKEQKEENKGGPIYSFLISLTSHTPYEMDDKYKELEILPEHKDNIVADYLQAIHYTDKYLGLFIEELKKEGLYDNSIIAIYGDHFGVNNSNPEVFQPMKDILGEKYNFDHIMNIPLLFKIPGSQVKETVSYLGSQIDFLPTLLNLLGIENKKGIMFGRDLINFGEGNLAFPQTMVRKGSVISQDGILIFSGDGMFNNSKAFNRITRESLDIEEFREAYNQALEEIRLSNLVLENNLILNLVRESYRPREEEALKGNILKDIERVDFFKKDLSWEENFENKEILSIDLDSLEDLQGLSNFMKEEENTALAIVRTRDEVRKEANNFANLRNQDREFMLENRYIALYSDYEDYFFIHRERYNNLILDLDQEEFDQEKLLEFLKLNKHIGIVLPRPRIEEGLVEELEALNIKIFIREGELLLSYN